MRLHEEAPSLRGDDTYPVVMDAIGRSSNEAFRVIAYSAQSNHLHAMVEAESTKDLSKGMQGMNSRITRAVNKLHHRRGTIWADRYHAHELTCPTETRNAYAYILLNHQHHNEKANGIDPCSSGFWHTDWDDAPYGIPSPVVPARTWLLRVGWRLTAKGPYLPSPNRYRF
jgi:putative transposase